MNIVKYVFAQLVIFLDRSKFNRTVAKYTGDAYVKFFTCWNQLLVMMFGQLTNRESLRDLVVALDSTTIDLCLGVFWWAKFHKRKGGIKVHALYDVETQIPEFFHITTASVHDSEYLSHG